MARLILEQPCEHGSCGFHYMWMWNQGARTTQGSPCPGGSRTFLGPDDLPSHRIEAAARAWAKLEGTRWGSITPAGKTGMVEVAEAMIRAFLETDDKEESDAPVN